MSKRVKSVLAALAMVGLATGHAGCFGGGSSYGASDVVDQTPTGLMAGADWTMQSVVVRASGDRLDVDMYPTVVEDCDAFAEWDTKIQFGVPAMEGEYPLRFSLTDLANSQTITFNPGPSDNVIATQGVIVIESLVDGQVTLGLIADAEDHEINGRFTTTVCE